MIAANIPFPREIPASYQTIDGEPEFDPARHLALEMPERIWKLKDFGYDEHIRARYPSQVAVTSPLKVLTAEGVAALREVGEGFKRLELKTEGNPDAAYVKPRGVVYSSTFARDLSRDADLADFLSRIAGTPLAPHTIPTLAAGFVFAPPDVSKTNQGWHLDSLGFGLVIMVSDPEELDGGSFQYFNGTSMEAVRLVGLSDPSELRSSIGKLGAIPEDRILTIDYPCAGYGMFMQGNLILHRGEPLRRPAERSVFVPGFIARDMTFDDVTNWQEVREWNSPTLLQEYARYKAWRARARLDEVIEEIPLDSDPSIFRQALLRTIDEIQEGVEELRPRERNIATLAASASDCD